MKICLAACLSLIGLNLMLSAPAAAPALPEKGSCIFATQFPEFGKEADYAKLGIQVKQSFRRGEPMFARCYFPAPMGEFRKKSLTGKAQRKEFISLRVINDKGEWEMVEGETRPIQGDPKDDWDQAGSADLSQSRVYGLIEELLAAESFKKIKHPDKHKLQICLSQNYYFDAIEKLVPEGAGFTKVYDQQHVQLAGGCATVDASP